MKPIIALLAKTDDEITTSVQDGYVRAIETAGGIPILLPYVNEDETIDSFIDLCDGFFFTGGADVAPDYYGETKKDTCGLIQKYRDELEFRVLKKVLLTAKPIIAVCRGAQLVNVALGGTLYQDIPSEIDTELQHRQKEAKNLPSHSVRVIEGTPLYELCGKKVIPANSFHHQAIKELGQDLSVMALADDGIIEAIYSTSHCYMRAYQWHPERLCDSEENNRKIFEDFISACKE